MPKTTLNDMCVMWKSVERSDKLVAFAWVTCIEDDGTEEQQLWQFSGRRKYPFSNLNSRVILRGISPNLIKSKVLRQGRIKSNRDYSLRCRAVDNDEALEREMVRSLAWYVQQVCRADGLGYSGKSNPSSMRFEGAWSTLYPLIKDGKLIEEEKSNVPSYVLNRTVPAIVVDEESPMPEDPGKRFAVCMIDRGLEGLVSMGEKVVVLSSDRPDGVIMVKTSSGKHIEAFAERFEMLEEAAR